MFPFVKLAEYIFTQHVDKVLDGTFALTYRGSNSIDTKVYETIHTRSFELTRSITESVTRILDTSLCSNRDRDALDERGFWIEEKEWFISDYLLPEYFKETKKKLIYFHISTLIFFRGKRRQIVRELSALFSLLRSSCASSLVI